jgi:hypothetical protein
VERAGMEGAAVLSFESDASGSHKS